MFIRNTWYVAAEPQEVTRDKPLARTILNERIVMYRGRDGRPVAFADACPHRYAPLSRGRIEEDGIRCPYHGGLYGDSGVCLRVPGQTGEHGKDAKLRAYPTVERHGYAWIWMGDPARASDESSIPAFFVSADPESPVWSGRHDKFLSMPIYYELINDNLHDITHTEWVHPETIGAELMGRLYRLAKGDESTETYAKKEFGTRTINLHFHIENVQAGPMFHQMVGFGRNEEIYRDKIDLDLFINYATPSFYNFNPRPRPRGEPHETAIQFSSLHAITPETNSTCHYFFYSAHNYRGPAERVAQFTKFCADGLTFAFGQDKDLITEQMLRVPDGGRDTASLTRVSFMGDSLPILGRKMIRTQIAAEREERDSVAAE